MVRLSMMIRSWVYPGINLHTRLRYRRVPRHFGKGSSEHPLSILDAGSGNGMLAYKASLASNRVLGVSFKSAEVDKAQKLLNGYRQISRDRLEFRVANLYEVDFPSASFDEVICSEVLEHLRRDEYVCEQFHRWLRPGGVLHLCAPNAEHPYNAAYPLDENESGGHVRSGYTVASYRALLEPIGFEIVETEGLGGAVRQFFNSRIKNVQRRYGALAGFPLFIIALLILPFESRRSEQEMPFSIYVRATKSK